MSAIKIQKFCFYLLSIDFYQFIFEPFLVSLWVFFIFCYCYSYSNICEKTKIISKILIWKKKRNQWISLKQNSTVWILINFVLFIFLVFVCLYDIRLHSLAVFYLYIFVSVWAKWLFLLLLFRFFLHFVLLI